MSADDILTTFPPGTVVRYECRAGEERQQDRNWCREGMAVADKDGRLIDTYWASMSEAHVLTAAEYDTAEVLFNVYDFVEIDRHQRSSATWETYAEEDRAVITSQHRLQFRWFIRKGAEPDLETQIDNASRRLQDARSTLQSAVRDVEWRARELAVLEAKR